MFRTISETTLVPISMLTMVAVIMFWAAHLDNTVQAQVTKVSKLEERIEQIALLRTDIEVIRTNVEFIKMKMEKKNDASK